jgi:spore maturation protein CgeB
MGGLMLSERTPELESFFKEGAEAVFFSNPEELLEKVNYILADDILQQNIRKQAKEKSVLAGYDLDGRVSKLMNDLIC